MANKGRERIARLNFGEALEEADRRRAELAEQVKAKAAAHAALEPRLEAARAAAEREADELLAHAKERGHWWPEMIAADEARGAFLLAGTLHAFSVGTEWNSERELERLRGELRAAKRRCRELRSLPVAPPDEEGRE